MPGARPNIVLILTDHFRRDALGPGTPSLMRLTQFTHAKEERRLQRVRVP